MGILGSLHDSRKLLTSNLYHITSHTPTSEFYHLENPHGVTKITLAERKKRKFAICTFVLRLTGVHDNGAHFRTVSCLGEIYLPLYFVCHLLPFYSLRAPRSYAFCSVNLAKGEKTRNSMMQKVNLPPLVSSGCNGSAVYRGNMGGGKE